MLKFSDYKLVYKASSVIERDAVINELMSFGILAFTKNDKPSVFSMAYSTVLPYSELQKDFPVFVPKNEESKSVEIINKFNLEISKVIKTPKYMYRFYLNCWSTLCLPIVCHYFAIKYFLLALKNKEEINYSKVGLYFTLLFVSALYAGFLIYFFINIFFENP